MSLALPVINPLIENPPGSAVARVNLHRRAPAGQFLVYNDPTTCVRRSAYDLNLGTHTHGKNGIAAHGRTDSVCKVSARPTKGDPKMRKYLSLKRVEGGSFREEWIEAAKREGIHELVC